MENPYREYLFYNPALLQSLLQAAQELDTEHNYSAKKNNTHMRSITYNFAGGLEWHQELGKPSVERKPKLYRCRKCNKEYGSHWDFNIHKADHEGQPKYNCKCCNYTTNSCSNYNRHMESQRHIAMKDWDEAFKKLSKT